MKGPLTVFRDFPPDRLAADRHARAYPPGPIDTSKLGPVRLDPLATAARFARAQEFVSRLVDLRSVDFAGAVQAALDFEESERKRSRG